jgi:hypothetical protein
MDFIISVKKDSYVLFNLRIEFSILSTLCCMGRKINIRLPKNVFIGVITFYEIRTFYESLYCFCRQ